MVAQGFDIQYEGVDELSYWIRQFPQAVLPLAVRTMDLNALVYQGYISEYPAETEANQPGRYSLRTHRPMGYYERGRGSWRPITKLKTLGGKTKKSEGVQRLGKRQAKLVGVVGYKLNPNSETLGRKWYHDVTAHPGEIVAEVGNSASYMTYVSGPEQSKLFEARGWPNPTTAMTESEPKFDQNFTELLDGIQRDFAKG